MKSKEVIEEIKASGLRGKGGGGFRTGVKWEKAASIQSDRRYIVVNGDEGNPNIRCPRCSESRANRIAGIEETGCLARARGQEGAASSARTFMSPSDRVFWAISAGEMMG